MPTCNASLPRSSAYADTMNQNPRYFCPSENLFLLFSHKLLSHTRIQYTQLPPHLFQSTSIYFQQLAERQIMTGSKHVNRVLDIRCFRDDIPPTVSGQEVGLLTSQGSQLNPRERGNVETIKLQARCDSFLYNPVPDLKIPRAPPNLLSSHGAVITFLSKIYSVTCGP